MGKYPVIALTLKDVSGESYDDALKIMSQVLKKEARRHQYLLESERLTEIDKSSLRELYTKYLDEDVQQESIALLSEMLAKHYGNGVIILIDEYDVPLDKAYQNRYYPKMVRLIRSLFSQALKTNENLEFAVITGCLRIAKESIFTGLNNFMVHSISDIDFAEYFGFTDREVKQLLKYYGVEKRLSVLFATGYLTNTGETAGGYHRLVIPNQEVLGIYEKKIRSWFKVKVIRNSEKWNEFCTAVRDGDAETFQDIFTGRNSSTCFYHGMLLGLLKAEGSWVTKSNAESGIGYTDIKITVPSMKIGCIIEVKYAEEGRFDSACREAMKQIENSGYVSALKLEGMETIHKYGIACYKKTCHVTYSRE